MPEIIEEHDVYTGWLRIIRRKIRHANGGVQEYEIVNPDSHAACAVVFDQNENVVLVEMYRFGAPWFSGGRWCSVAGLRIRVRGMRA